MKCENCVYWQYDELDGEGFCNFDPDVDDDPCEEISSYYEEDYPEDFPDDHLTDIEMDFNPYMGCYDYDIDNFGGGFFDEF